MQTFSKCAGWALPSFLLVVFAFIGTYQCDGQDYHPVSFVRQIAPILSKECLACHEAKRAKGGYRLDTFENLIAAGDSGKPVIRSGDPQNSLFFRLLLASDPEDRMPKEDDALTKVQTDLIRRWIREGARYDGKDAAAAWGSELLRPEFPVPPKNYLQAIPITALAWGTDSFELITSGYHEILFWDTSTGLLKHRIPNIPERCESLSLSPDQQQILVVGGQPGVMGEWSLFDVKTRQLKKRKKVGSDVLWCAAFSPSGDTFVIGDSRGRIHQFDANNGEQLMELELHADWVTDVAWSSNTNYIVSASRDRSVRVYNIQLQEMLGGFLGHQAPVYAAVFGEGDTDVVSFGLDQRARKWEVQKQKQGWVSSKFQGQVTLLGSWREYMIISAGRQWMRLGAKNKTSPKFELSGSASSLDIRQEDGLLAIGTFEGVVEWFGMIDGEKMGSFQATP